MADYRTCGNDGIDFCSEVRDFFNKCVIDSEIEQTNVK